MRRVDSGGLARAARDNNLFGHRRTCPSGGIEGVQMMRRPIIPLLPLVTALSAAVAADPPSPKQDKPAENKAPLVCELRDLPEKARPGEELKLVVRLSNTGDKPFPLLGHHVEVTRTDRRPRATRLMIGDHSQVDLQ